MLDHPVAGSRFELAASIKDKRCEQLTAAE
jgi:hypothetical protein